METKVFKLPATLFKQKIDFELPDTFLDNYRGKQPNWGPLGYVTAKRTYCRKIYSEDRTEEWWEVLKRVVEGEFSIQKRHCINNGLPWNEKKAIKSAQKTYELMWNFKFLPPGRGLWMMGTDFVKERGGLALNNCAFTSTKNILNEGANPFCWTMDALMQGVGVGFDTRGAGKLRIKKPFHNSFNYVIEDSREGWVKALEFLLNGYFFGEDIPKLDFSAIRKKGEPIKGFGGTASGPQPLIDMISSLTDLLEAKIGEYLNSVDIVDIFNYIAKCVVAGNVRRSAQIAIGNIYDNKFVNAKQDKEALTDRRWASNNSVIAGPGTDYNIVADKISSNGEPGILFLSNMQEYGRMIDPPNYLDMEALGTNPCGEQTLEDRELCCLVETFPSNHDSLEEYLTTLKYAYIYGKTVTLLKTKYPSTNAVMLKNRRMGISQTGIIEAFVKHGRTKMLKWCDIGYNYILDIDRKYSRDWLSVPESKKITSVKPSGTVSLLAGVSAGIHYPHSKYYIRRIRFSANHDFLPKIREAGYNVLPDPYSKQKDGSFSTYYVEFPIKEENFDRAKAEVSMWEQVQNAIDYQHYWADNQVSITVTFNKYEKEQIPYLLETVEDKLKGLSMLPLLDHDYVAAPYEKITKDQYYEMESKITPIDLSSSNEEAEGESGCQTDVCMLKEEIDKLF